MIEFLEANWLTIAVIGGIAAFFLLLRNRPSRIGALDEVVGNGQPIIVEIFSNT